MYEDKSKQGTEPWRAPKKTPVAPDRGYKYLDMDGDPTETRKAVDRLRYRRKDDNHEGLFSNRDRNNTFHDGHY